jgi:hypothetical protein
MFRETQNVAGLFLKHASSLGERDTARGALKQAGPDFVFEPQQLLTQRGLGDTERNRGAADRTGRCDLQETPQVPGVHARS